MGVQWASSSICLVNFLDGMSIDDTKGMQKDLYWQAKRELSDFSEPL